MEALCVELKLFRFIKTMVYRSWEKRSQTYAHVQQLIKVEFENSEADRLRLSFFGEDSL